MKRAQIAAIPAIPARGGHEAKKVSLFDLKTVTVGLVTNTLRKGDTFEFPDTVEDVQVYKQTFANGTSYLILGLRNEKPYWLSIGALKRLDCNMNPIHEVSEYLVGTPAIKDLVLKMLGKRIVADGDITYNATVFVDGKPTKDIEAKTVANLRFF